jgi:hypothetical protein
MHEGISLKYLTILLNKHLASLKIPLYSLWIDTSPSCYILTIIWHRIKWPNIKKFSLSRRIIYSFNIVASSNCIIWSLFCQTIFKRHIQYCNIVSRKVSFWIMIPLYIHIVLLFLFKRLSPFKPLLFIPSICIIPSITTNHISCQNS